MTKSLNIGGVVFRKTTRANGTVRITVTARAKNAKASWLIHEDDEAASLRQLALVMTEMHRRRPGACA